jgi:hypothetical protein
MTKKRKVFTLGLIILMVLASFPLTAYDLGSAENATEVPDATKPMADGPASPTNKASAGRFGTDVDNILSLIDWSDVNKEGKWLGFAGWDNNLFSLGYARKIGGIYLGAWYNGNVVSAGEQDTEFVSVTYDDAGNPTREESGYLPVATQPWVYSNNRLSLLVGIANMGINLDVRENYLGKELPQDSSVRTEDKVAGTVSGNKEVTDYKYLKGWTDIYAGWGMPLSLGSLSVKPTAQLGVQLYSNDQNTVSKTSSTNPGSLVYTDTDIVATAQAGKNTAFIRPNIAVGASVGGLPWGLGAALEYAINFDIYTSSYDLYGGSDPVAGDVSWDFWNNYSYSNTTPTQSKSVTAGGVTVEEKTRLQQIITPSLTYATDLGDRVEFGLKFDLPFTVDSKTSGGKYTETWKTETTTPTGGVTTKTETHTVLYTSGESETSGFAVAPALYIGTQIKAIPNKLTINLGLTNAIEYSSEKTLTKPTGVGYKTEKVTANGAVTKDEKTSDPIGTKYDYSSVKESWSGLDAKISAGFTFYFNPNFLVDTYYTAQITDEAGSTDKGSSGISFGDTGFWEDVVAGKFALMFTIKK